VKRWDYLTAHLPKDKNVDETYGKPENDKLNLTAHWKMNCYLQLETVHPLVY
jgi:hypothetical protein